MLTMSMSNTPRFDGIVSHISVHLPSRLLLLHMLQKTLNNLILHLMMASTE